MARDKVIPVFAHLERYDLTKQRLSVLRDLARMDGYMQINAESFLSFRSRRKIKILLKNQLLHVIGSDMHSAEGSVYSIEKAWQYMQQHLDKTLLDMLEYNVSTILQNKRP